jgi:hypothetical protein
MRLYDSLFQRPKSGSGIPGEESVFRVVLRQRCSNIGYGETDLTIGYGETDLTIGYGCGTVYHWIWGTSDIGYGEMIYKIGRSIVKDETTWRIG